MRVIRQIDSKEILVISDSQKVIMVIPRGKYPDEMPMDELSKMVRDDLELQAVAAVQALSRWPFTTY